MAKLVFNHGVMDSGKSVELLRVDYQYTTRGLTPVVTKPEIDSRRKSMVWSRLGLERETDFLLTPTDLPSQKLLEHVEKIAVPADILLIDEAQFLTPDQVEDLYYVVTLELEVPVMAYGLRTDFQMTTFPGSARLLALADKINEIKSTCNTHGCGKLARCNTRKINGEYVFSGQQVAIDGQDNGVVSYESLCKLCYNEARSASLSR